MREKMTLRKWYGGAIRIPPLAHYSFNAFISGCVGLVRSVFETKTANLVRVRFMRSGTASADPLHNIIYINEDYLKGNIVGRTIHLSEDVITILLGIIVHEAAHFAYSPPDLQDACDHILKNTGCTYVQGIAASIANIVEDIWIEAEVDRRIPALTWMLEAVNEVFFSDADARVRAVKAIDSAPTTMAEVATVCNVLILAKVSGEVKCNPFVTDLFNLARTATHLSVREERFALALRIYDALMLEIPKVVYESNLAYVLDSLKKSTLGPNADRTDVLSMKPMMPANNTEGGKLNDSLEETEGFTYLKPRDVESVLNDGTLMILEKALPFGPAVSIDKRYSKLAEVGRQRAVVAHPYGEAKVRGNSMRRLHRIATDQRIFADRVDFGSYKPMQVLILVDCSGSMRGDEIEQASEAAAGAALALAEARCDVAVYGHTADVFARGQLVIYRAKGFNESVSVVPHRLGAIVTEQMSNNRDGSAIEYLSTKLTDVRKRRVMVVISDGCPAGTFYTGQAAIDHSKRRVDEVRKQGIEVLSISIEVNAIAPNNQIYGVANNVFNKDPHVIRDIISKLMGL